jgi:hypothetical protein
VYGANGKTRNYDAFAKVGPLLSLSHLRLTALLGHITVVSLREAVLGNRTTPTTQTISTRRMPASPARIYNHPRSTCTFRTVCLFLKQSDCLTCIFFARCLLTCLFHRCYTQTSDIAKVQCMPAIANPKQVILHPLAWLCELNKQT